MYTTTHTQMPDERKNLRFRINKLAHLPLPLANSRRYEFMGARKNGCARAREMRVPSCVLFFLTAIQLPSTCYAG